MKQLDVGPTYIYFKSELKIVFLVEKLGARIRSMGLGWVQFYLVDYTWIYLDTQV